MSQLFVPESLVVTLDAANGFHSEEAVFDVGGPAVTVTHATLLAADLDGLTWGEEEGNVTLGLVGTPQQSEDGVSWLKAPITGTEQIDYKGIGPLPFELTYGALITPRFVRVPLGFFQWPGALQYEGEANLTATIRVELRAG